MSQQQARLRSQDLFKMEKNKDITIADTSKSKSIDELAPEVKMVIEEKLKQLNTTKQPIIMPTIPVDSETAKPSVIQDFFHMEKNKVQPKQTTVTTLSEENCKNILLSKAYKKNKSKHKGSAIIRVTERPDKARVAKSKQPPPSRGGAVNLKQPPGLVSPNQDVPNHLKSKQQPGPPMAYLQNTPTNMESKQQPGPSMFQPPTFQRPYYQQPGPQSGMWPKGIPRSFLTRPEAPGMAQTPYMSLPSGIPRSFLLQGGPANVVHPHYAAIPQGDYVMHTPQNQVPVAITPENLEADVAIFENRDPQLDQYTPFETKENEEEHEGSESPDLLEAGQKRLSAFKRLGPLTQPKKPKLTINLMINKEEAVREVVDDDPKEAVTHVPVHLRKDLMDSTDEIVVMYLDKWPWKKPVSIRKPVTTTTPKAVQYQIMEHYDKDSGFIQITVKGYPSTWTKEDVLDTILDAIKGKSFIPCFIEFTEEICKFFVIRCRSALFAIHNLGFSIRKGEVELILTVAVSFINLRLLNFVPRNILMKKLVSGYNGEKSVSLKAFTLQPDISHFIYFPLRCGANQTDIMQLQSAVPWERLTELNLSHNNLISIDGFDLTTYTPKLNHLDLSYNNLGSIRCLLKLRDLALRSIKLEGNPLVLNYIDPDYYVKVFKTLFSSLREIDGTPITFRGQMPAFLKVYCPDYAKAVVDKFLSIFFPLLDSAPEDRTSMEPLYDEEAVLTITFRYKLRYSPGYRYFRNLFLRSRILEEDEMESVVGAPSIVKLFSKWPTMSHDPSSFTIDVLHHNEWSTIIKIGGILKLTSETLAEDEHLMTFTRTLVLQMTSDVEYKIQHELLYWDEPTKEYARTAFSMTAVRPMKLSLKMESAPDEFLKKHLVDIFVKLTDLDHKASERCLILKEWNLKSALEYFVKLLKLDGLQSLEAKELHESASQLTFNK